MPILLHPPAERVAAEIAALPPGALVATDADGTLWGADVGDLLVEAATEWLPEPPDLDAYYARIAADYAGACRYAAVLSGRGEPAQVRSALRTRLADSLRPRSALVEPLRAAAARGVRVWVVSASPRLAIEVGLDLLGVTDWSILAIEPESEDTCVEPAPVHHGKPKAWAARALPAPALAFGDTDYDHPLLESAVLGIRLARFI